MLVELGRDVARRRADRGACVHSFQGRADDLVVRARRVEGEEREDLEEDRPQGVDVGARVERASVADRLLRRHVSRRPHHRAQGGARRARVGGIGGDGPLPVALGGGRVLHDLRQSPVEDVHLAEIAQHHVVGLEIPMNHAARVGEVDREADAGERSQKLVARPLRARWRRRRRGARRSPGRTSFRAAAAS